MGCINGAGNAIGSIFGPMAITTLGTFYLGVSAMVVGIATWALKTLADSFISASTSATLGKVARVSIATSLVAFLAIPVVAIGSLALTFLGLGCSSRESAKSEG